MSSGPGPFDLRIKKGRQRIAFLVEVGVLAAVTVGSIWFASRIGYQGAVRFARHEELRASRNLVAAADHELAVSAARVRRALEDWDSEAFRHIHLAFRAFDRLQASDEFFLMGASAVSALEDAHGSLLLKTMEGLRKAPVGPPARGWAANLQLGLERLEVARGALGPELERLERSLSSSGVEDLARPLPRSAVAEGSAPPGVLEPGRLSASGASGAGPSPALRSNRGWTRVEGAPYRGPLPELHRGAVTVPAKPAGPVGITYRASLPSGRKAVRLWLYLARTAPAFVTRDIRASTDAALLRRLVGGEGATVLTRRVSSPQGEIVDPNRPVGWRWAWLLLEDDAGRRHTVFEPWSWKLGKETDGWKFVLKPGPDAFRLPEGYLR